jgi:hypothetical protein
MKTSHGFKNGFDEQGDEGERHYDAFENEQMTGALLDRLVHRSHVLMMEGESFRFRQSLQQQDGSPDR